MGFHCFNFEILSNQITFQVFNHSKQTRVHKERMNSVGCSLSISSHVSHNAENDGAECECECVSEAGDIGDRALPSTFSFDNNSEENGALVSLSEDHTLQPCPSFSHPNSSLEPLPPQLTSTLASQDAKQVQVSILQHFVNKSYL